MFDDLLNTSQKLKEPFFARGRHNDLDVHFYHKVTSIYLNEPYETIVIM